MLTAGLGVCCSAAVQPGALLPLPDKQDSSVIPVLMRQHGEVYDNDDDDYDTCAAGAHSSRMRVHWTALPKCMAVGQPTIQSMNTLLQRLLTTATSA